MKTKIISHGFGLISPPQSATTTPVTCNNNHISTNQNGTHNSNNQSQLSNDIHAKFNNQSESSNAMRSNHRSQSDSSNAVKSKLDQFGSNHATSNGYALAPNCNPKSVSSYFGVGNSSSLVAQSLFSNRDDNPLITDHDDDDNDSFYDDHQELTEWHLDDFTPSASRSTSFYKGFFDSTHDKLSTVGGTLFRKGSSAPFQTGLCITLALGFICGVFGLFLGTIVASWSEEPCAESIENKNDFWQQQFDEILSDRKPNWMQDTVKNIGLHSSSSQSNPISRDPTIDPTGETNITPPMEQVLADMNKFDLGWHSMIVEKMENVPIYRAISANFSIPNQSINQVTRFLQMEDSLVPFKEYFYGKISDIGSCDRLASNTIKDFGSPTLLLCGYSDPMTSTIPLIWDPSIQMLVVFNRSSQSRTPGSSHNSLSAEYDSQSQTKYHHTNSYDSDIVTSLNRVPVPHIVVSEAIPSVFSENNILLTIESKINNRNFTYAKAFIKGATFNDELIVIASNINNKESMQLMTAILSSMSKLKEKGWNPIRSILFLIWDGSEISMRQWIQTHRDLLHAQLQSFIDLSNPIQGYDTFSASGSVALKQAVFIASKQVISRHSDAYTLYDRWLHCVPEALPFNYTVPRMSYSSISAASKLIQEQLPAAVLSLHFQHVQKSSSWTMNQLCESGKYSSQSRPSDLQLIHSLSQVAVRLMIMLTNDPMLPFNVVDVTHAITQALPADFDSEVRSVLDRLQIESTHIHAFLDFTVPAHSISSQEARSLNQRLLSTSFNSLEPILIKYGFHLDRVKQMTHVLKQQENDFKENHKSVGAILTQTRAEIKSHLQNALSLLSAQSV